MSLCNGAWSVVFTVLTSSCMAVWSVVFTVLTLSCMAVWSVVFTVLTSSCMAVCGALPLLFSHNLLFSHQVVWLCVECRLYCSHIKLYGCVWSVDFTVLTSFYCSHITLYGCAWRDTFTVLTSCCMAVRGEIPLLFSHRVVEGGGGGTANATLS